MQTAWCQRTDPSPSSLSLSPISVRFHLAFPLSLFHSSAFVSSLQLVSLRSFSSPLLSLQRLHTCVSPLPLLFSSRVYFLLSAWLGGQARTAKPRAFYVILSSRVCNCRNRCVHHRRSCSSRAHLPLCTRWPSPSEGFEGAEEIREWEFAI